MKADTKCGLCGHTKAVKSRHFQNVWHCTRCDGVYVDGNWMTIDNACEATSKRWKDKHGSTTR